MLTLRLVFHLALRQAEAFSRSVLRLLGLALLVPDHSTLSRRGRAFAGRQLRVQASTGPVHLVLDSTGLKLFGQGEWDAKKHGRARRQWRKLHLAVDAGTGEIGRHRTPLNENVWEYESTPSIAGLLAGRDSQTRVHAKARAT